MKVHTVHFCAPNDKRERFIACDVDVPGLGRVTINNCITEETMQAVEAQVLEALRSKLKLTTTEAEKI